MRIFRRLSTLYIFGLALLIAVLITASISFNYVYLSSEEILSLTESLVSRDTALSLPNANEFTNVLDDIRSIKIMAYVFFAIALLLSSGGVLLIFYIHKKNVVEPLSQITSATNKMAQGQFERIPAIAGTEIGALAENFNYMGQSLKNKISELKEALTREQSVVRTLNILNELGSSIIFKFNVDEILSTLVSFSNTITKAEMGAIFLIDRISHQITYSFLSLPKEKGDITELGQNIVYELVDSGTPIRWDASSKDKKFTDIVARTNVEIKSFLAVPVMVEGFVLGGLILINKMDTDKFTMQDEDTALMVSFQGGMAIEKTLYHEEIVQMAKTDGLTGLKNHRTFHEELDEEIKRARRFNRYLALLLIDIDFFKKFNDTYGHQGGDTALKELAGILRENLRSIDSAARYGGEEFTVILPETSIEGGIKTAEKIRKEVNIHTFNVMGIGTELTVSIGVSVFPDDAINKEGLIKGADDALYMAKRRGRNMVVTYEQYKMEATRLK